MPKTTGSPFTFTVVLIAENGPGESGWEVQWLLYREEYGFPTCVGRIWGSFTHNDWGPCTTEKMVLLSPAATVALPVTCAEAVSVAVTVCRPELHRTPPEKVWIPASAAVKV
jgi:hypothetical protein